MITEKDLLEAIAECQGVRNPDAKTCMKLAAFYTILDHLNDKEQNAETLNYSYSYDSPPTQLQEIVDYRKKSEFSELINGQEAYGVWAIMDELMDTLKAINPRLYNSVIRRLKE